MAIGISYSLCGSLWINSSFIVFFFLFFFFLREGEEGGGETSICCFTYLHIHWLLLVCVLSRDWTHNPGILGQCSNPLSHLPRGNSSFLSRNNTLCGWLFHSVFNYLTIEGHLGCLHIWTIMNKAAISLRVQVFMWKQTFDTAGCTWDCDGWVVWWDMFSFERSCPNASKMTLSFSICPSNKPEFLLLYIFLAFGIVSVLDLSHFNRCVVVQV